MDSYLPVKAIGRFSELPPVLFFIVNTVKPGFGLPESTFLLSTQFQRGACLARNVVATVFLKTREVLLLIPLQFGCFIGLTSTLGR